MTRRSGQAADHGTRPRRSAPDGRGEIVALVAAEPADAVPLVALQEAGARLTVICLAPGDRAGRARLDRALSEAEGRGCAVAEPPRVLGVAGADAVPALVDALEGVRPDRVHTLDPDPARTDFDEASGRPVHREPPRHAEAAGAVLAAARDLQERTGVPVAVDCLRADADLRLGAAACRRYPAAVRWLTAGVDNRLTAFAATAAGVVRWYQDLPGSSTWHGPELVEGIGLVPGLCITTDGLGFPHLFGLRRTQRTDGQADVEVVHATQHRTGHSLTPWESLGGPNAAQPAKGREAGFPTAAHDKAGNLYVFVRNFGHSVSYRCQGADGIWTPWQHLGGTRVADDLVAVPSPHGGVEVYARARDTTAVVRWYQGQAGAWTEDRNVPFAAVPGTLTAAPEPGSVLFRDLHTGTAGTWRPGAQAPCPLGEADGAGPMAPAGGVAMGGWRYSLLATAGEAGSCGVGVYPEGRPGAGVWWQDLGPVGAAVPAAIVDRAGRLTVAARTAGGELLVTHRVEREDSLIFDSWYSPKVVHRIL
ncbi:hypothetical protein [Streptomyces longispororuber]|uniref:hypothetical protein n=1 Tax=Streptomyces longispororuber TaxID=68230 RepID=UPI00210B27A4|nr:hypothetical protein [Streptomyces longispororuber]MCQ4210621.1 hypothetical protein [Streptomyces longispororuber]